MEPVDPKELEKFWEDVLEAEGMPAELAPEEADSLEELAEREEAVLWLPED